MTGSTRGAGWSCSPPSAYEEPPTTVVVGAARAAALVAELPVLHSGPQEVLRVGGQRGRGRRRPRAAPRPADRPDHDRPGAGAGVRPPPAPPPHGRPGGHPARRLGDGLDFRDLAPFAPGDRLRRIDWRATARSPHQESELIVRRMDASAEAAAVIALDSRDDVGSVIVEWGSNRPARKGVSSLDIAAPGRRGDRRRPTSKPATASRSTTSSRPGGSARSGGGRRKLEQIRAVVNQTLARPGGSLRSPVLPSGAVVYLVSTFLDDDVAALAVLWRSAGHRVVAVDVLPEPSLEGADEEHRLAHRILQLERERPAGPAASRRRRGRRVARRRTATCCCGRPSAAGCAVSGATRPRGAGALPHRPVGARASCCRSRSA